MKERMNGQTDRQTYEKKERQMDRWMDGWMNGQMKQSPLNYFALKLFVYDYGRAKAERSRACICSGFVVGVPGSNPTWGCFFLNKKKIRFSEVGWCVEQIVKKVTMGNESSISLGGTIILLAHFAKNNILSRLVISGVRYKGTLCWSNKMRL